MGTGEKFLNTTAMACAVRSRIDKWDLMKLQSFCKAKDIINKTKRPPKDWERIFTNPKSDRGHTKLGKRWAARKVMRSLQRACPVSVRVFTDFSSSFQVPKDPRPPLAKPSQSWLQ